MSDGFDLEEMKRNATPVRRLTDPKVREALKRAGIVWGVDVITGSTSLFYGKEMLEDIARGRAAEWGPQMTVAFSLDFSTDELEYLAAAVQVLKGSCCYNKDDRAS